jgi:3-oxo-5alpha-steroid 4-dehydrogenase
MFRYLQLEVQDAVDEATLRAYCDESLDNLHFLEALGVPFPARGSAPKTSYPEDDVTLYFSGNELCPPYSETARTAPRGNRVLGKGLTGKVLFQHLRQATAGLGIEVRTHSQVRRLLLDDTGSPCGVVVRSLPANSLIRQLHDWCADTAGYGGMLVPALLRAGQALLQKIEERFGVESEIRCRGGVVLAAGGFVHNRPLIAEQAPLFSHSMPLGTPGDDGSGHALGTSAGGQLDRMERIGAWRFINPPVSLTRGVLVDRQGGRICNEELYGATLGERIAERADGRAVLVIDAEIRRQVLRDLWATRKANFQTAAGLINLFINRKRAGTLPELARASGLPEAALVKTLDEYNALARHGHPDPEGKSAGAYQALETAPYFAIDCDLDSSWFPTPTFTLGGLRVRGETGEVVRADGSAIEGLYAVGRNAIGISSHSYVSGLSVGDCVFSGRRAGRHAATRALTLSDSV